jgi:hypothetical protein
MISKDAIRLLFVPTVLLFVGTCQAKAQTTGVPEHADYLDEVMTKGYSIFLRPGELSKLMDAKIKGAEDTLDHAQRKVKSWFKSGYEHFSSAAAAEAVGNVTGINRKRTYETYLAGYAASSEDWSEVGTRIGRIAGSKLSSVAQSSVIGATGADLGFDPVQTKNLEEIIKGQQAFRNMIVRHGGTVKSPLYNPYLEELGSSGAETKERAVAWSRDKPWRYRSELDLASQRDYRMTGDNEEYTRLKIRLSDEGQQAFSALGGEWSGTFQDAMVSNGVPITADGTITVAFNPGRESWHAKDVVGTATFSFTAWMVVPAGHTWQDGSGKRFRLDQGYVLAEELKWSPSGGMFYSDDGMAFFPDEDNGNIRMFRATDSTGRTFESDLGRGELDHGVVDQLTNRVNREIARGEYEAKFLARKQAASRRRLARTLKNIAAATQSVSSIINNVRSGSSGWGSSSSGQGGGDVCAQWCAVMNAQGASEVKPHSYIVAKQKVEELNCNCQ